MRYEFDGNLRELRREPWPRLHSWIARQRGWIRGVPEECKQGSREMATPSELKFRRHPPWGDSAIPPGAIELISVSPHGHGLCLIADLSGWGRKLYVTRDFGRTWIRARRAEWYWRFLSRFSFDWERASYGDCVADAEGYFYLRYSHPRERWFEGSAFEGWLRETPFEAWFNVVDTDVLVHAYTARWDGIGRSWRRWRTTAERLVAARDGDLIAISRNEIVRLNRGRGPGERLGDLTPLLDWLGNRLGRPVAVERLAANPEGRPLIRFEIQPCHQNSLFVLCRAWSFEERACRYFLVRTDDAMRPVSDASAGSPSWHVPISSGQAPSESEFALGVRCGEAAHLDRE